MDVQIEAFTEDDKRDYHPVQGLLIKQADFNSCRILQSQLVAAAQNVKGEGNLYRVQMLTLCEEGDEHLKLALKLVVVS